MQITKEKYVVLLLAAFIPTGLSLKCFQCNSAEYPACSDIVANDTLSPFLLECTGLYENQTPFCRKLATKVMVGGDERIIRTCGWILDEGVERKDFCKKSDSDFVLKKSCACFSEMCNSSNNNGATFWILSVSLIVSLIYLF